MKTLKFNQSRYLQNVCFFLIYTVYTTLMCVLARVFVPRVTAFSRRNSSLIHFCKIVSAFACGMYLLSCSFMPAYALADKNYRITDVNIYASLTTDGTLQVRERRTFEFKGSFKGVIIAIFLKFSCLVSFILFSVSSSLLSLLCKIPTITYIRCVGLLIVQSSTCTLHWY